MNQLQQDADGLAIENLQRVFALQKKAFLRNQNPSLAQRLEWVGAAIPMLMGNREKIKAALREDFAEHSSISADMIEILGLVHRAQYNLANLEQWMQDQDKSAGLELGSAKAYVRYQPKGVVGNMAPWNFPIDIGIGPMLDMLSAGNRVIIKPSDMTPACGEVLAEIVGQTYDEDQVAVVNGGIELAKHFPTLAWDHLLYTGGTAIGKEVMRAASSNLVPVTLELGGKCPAIIAEDRIDADAARHIVGVKSVKRGQMCVTVDHCLVPHDRLNEFVGLLQHQLEEHFVEGNGSKHATGIINHRHVERLQSWLDEAREGGAQIIQVGTATDPAKRNMPFTLVVNPPADCKLMQEEIFGPILPVLPYQDIDDAIAQVNAGERPLGLYVFANNTDLVEQVTANTSSGGVAVNTAAMQAGLPSLPFGGIGASGMGRHHGFEGFLEFSNPRGYYEQGSEPAALLAPFNETHEAIIAAAFAVE